MVRRSLKGWDKKVFHSTFTSLVKVLKPHKEGYPSFLFPVLASSQWVERVPNVTVPHIYL